MKAVDNAIALTVVLSLLGLGMIVYVVAAKRQCGPDALRIIVWATGGAMLLLATSCLFTVFEIIDAVLGWLA